MKYFLFFLAVLFSANLFAQSNFSTEQIQKLSRIQSKITFDGEAYKSRFSTGIKPAYNFPEVSSDAYSSISFVQLSSLRNYYDLESNGTPLQIWQDPSNPNNIHAVYTYSSQETGWADRTIQYFFSSDKGATWVFVGNVPSSGRAGFGTISGLSTGVALIGCHTNAGISTNVRTQFFVDAFPGLGSFTNLDPGGAANAYIWPRVVGGLNVSITNKFVFIASTSGADSSFYGIGTSINSSNFVPYSRINADPAECYSIARGSDGRIGIAYKIDDARFPTEVGDVYFTESTNFGSNFNTPVKIFDANLNTDSLGNLRGISMVYKGNTPCVVFETIKQTTSGTFFPASPSKIRFWSPAVNSGNSLIIADENNVPFAPARGTVDVEGPICRPSIGASADGNFLFCSMMVQNSATGGFDTTSYNDIYLARSSTSGATWTTPERITPTAPRNDWAYASISPYNDISGSNYYVNLMMQRDTIPGSNVNTSDTRTNARPYFVRVGYQGITVPPVVPTLVSPVNNSVNQSLTPTLTWTGNGEYYQVQVSTTSGFTNIIVDQTLFLSTSYQIPPPILTQSTTYYWRVKASTTGVGSSAFSSPFAFTTTSASLPAAPTLITPSNGATGVSTSPAFDWFDVAGATSFRLQVSTNSGFAPVLYDSANISLSQLNFPAVLQNATTYYWRVSASNTAGTGQYSTSYSFTTSVAPPAAPTLFSPSNGAIGISLTPTMAWVAVSGATGYSIQIATDLNFNNVVYNANSATNIHAIPSGTLILNTLYFWRVRASNAGGNGPYSAVWNFRSTTVNVNTIAGVIPTEYKLYGSYPNPFNPSTTIRFDIPKHSDVTIKVFDMTGKQVSELINLSLEAGAYETKFNASALASGIYYYRIEAGEFSDTKKMILVK
ncbi:MAG: T9SS type A sorting domain-containing protein [Bacteroidetes bacterium]|nr:T9SS type A sorting domain-containing protein [Bacteroidota bacterium]